MSVNADRELTIMLRMLRSVVVAAVLGGAVPTAAVAETQLVDEFKFGVLAHDVGLFDKHAETGSDLNFEMLFTPPEFFRVIGSPRPQLGGSLNTAGKTNDGYFGLTWGITLIQNLFGWGGSVFANGSLGGALQDGFNNSAPPDRKKLGTTAQRGEWRWRAPRSRRRARTSWRGRSGGSQSLHQSSPVRAKPFVSILVLIAIAAHIYAVLRARSFA